MLSSTHHLRPVGCVAHRPSVSWRAPLIPAKRNVGVIRAFADNVPGMADGNCITEATSKSIMASVGGGGGPSGGASGGSGGSGGGGSGGAGSSDGKHPMQLWTYLFAALLAVGGTVGYLRKGSTKSLGGGLSAAVILALAARSMAGPAAVNGARVAFAICLLLGIFFVRRFVTSKKVFPAGVVAGASLTMAASYVFCGL